LRNARAGAGAKSRLLVVQFNQGAENLYVRRVLSAHVLDNRTRPQDNTKLDGLVNIFGELRAGGNLLSDLT
jgi:hypothetical protein